MVSPEMLSQNFRLLLESEFSSRCQRNSQYSLRSFAQSLDIDASSLSQFMRNKRKFSAEKIKGLALKLNLDGENYIKYVCPEKAQEYHLIDLDQFNVISEWYHMAICQLLELDDFEYSVQWVGKRLGITASEAQLAINRLLRLGWVVERNNTLKYRGGNLSTVEQQITTMALKNFQKQILMMASNSLDDIPLELRSQTGMTMSINKSKIEKAKKMIIEFQRELCDFLEDVEHKEEVYQLNISLFPLTKIK